MTGRWRHYKGDLYDVLAMGRVEATGEPVVVYRSVSTSKVWTRPLAEWSQDVGGEPRYVKIAEIVGDDHAKRLTEIEAGHAREEQIVALGCEPSARHVERGWLLAEHRAASERLAAAGIPADMGSLAERVVLLHEDADQQTGLTTRLMGEKEAASEALAAAGIPEDSGSLAERLALLNRYGASYRESWERLRQSKNADDVARAHATHDLDILRRAAIAAAVSLGEALPKDAGPETIAASLRRGVERRMVRRGPALDVGDVSPAHLRALEIIACSGGTVAQVVLAKELVGMGTEAVAEAVRRAYEEGRFAEGRRLAAERDRFKAAILAANNALTEVCHGDHEHQIECHADTLPAEHRRVAGAAEQASGILAEVVLDIVEQGSRAGADDATEAAEALARCARGEHRKAGETMPGSCADCGVDWGDLDTEDEPATGLDVAFVGDAEGMAALVGLDASRPVEQTAGAAAHCLHEAVVYGPNMPLRHGSARTKVCTGCGAYKLVTWHDKDYSGWRSADVHADVALAEAESEDL